MRRFLGILACALAVGTSSAHGESDEETLKRFFPDRDLSKAVVKIVDRANGYYAVGDSLEVTKDGTVRSTNAVVVHLLGGGNQAPRYTAYEAPRMILTFAKPVRMPSDVAGNKIVTVRAEN